MPQVSFEFLPLTQRWWFDPHGSLGGFQKSLLFRLGCQPWPKLYTSPGPRPLKFSSLWKSFCLLLDHTKILVVAF